MDRRQRKTREAIFAAFIELLSKRDFTQITVGEIIAEAGETLTPEELEERTRLRNIYKESVVGNLRTHLESTTIVYPDGTKKKVTHK